ncbi:MAG: hypothetical protein ABIF87_09015, partial [Pseudomonadota bacterium]
LALFRSRRQSLWITEPKTKRRRHEFLPGAIQFGLLEKSRRIDANVLRDLESSIIPFPDRS